MTEACTFEKIVNKTIEEICIISKDCEFDYINLNELHYCTLNGNLYFSLPVLAFLGFICFYLLSDTANKYLSQALTNISDKLRLSQNLAGVTILAFGNGAPDVISSIVASDGTGEQGLDVAIGSLLGGGIFVSCLVFSMVVLFAKRVNLNREMFLRDLILYMLMIVFMIVMGVRKQMGIIETIFIFVIYILYVIIAIIQDRYSKKSNNNKPSQSMNDSIDFIKEEDDDSDPNKRISNIDEYIKKKVDTDRVVEYIYNKLEEDEEGIFILHYDRIFSKSNSKDDSAATTEKLLKNDDPENKIKNENDFIIENSQEISNDNINNVSNDNSNLDSIMNNEHFYKDVKRSENKNALKTFRKQKSFVPILVEQNYNGMLYRIKKHYFQHHEVKYSEKNIFQKILYIIIDFPFTLIRDFTIPCCEETKWNKNLLILNPILCPLFVISITNSFFLFTKFPFYVWIITAVVILILMIIIWKNTYRSKLPESIIILSFLSFIMSIFWIWFIAKILMNVLATLGLILSVPDSFLALTFLSFGNSAPDLSLNCALAKSGYGEMGIAGSIAGPLFNLMIGFGISSLKILMSRDYEPVKLDFGHNLNILLLVVEIIILVNLVRLLVQATWQKFKLNRSISILGFIFYLGFVVYICLKTFAFWN